MHSSSKALRLIATLLAAMPITALAHPGSGHVMGFLQGLAHPFTGIDHLLAMVAVGLLAGRIGGRAVLLVPVSFMSVMVAGAAAGMEGIVIPFVEIGIAASILAFGLLLAGGRDITLPATAMLVGFFAVFHGHAHGTEAASDISGFSYVAGFLIATAALHALGIMFALAASRYSGSAGTPLLRWGGVLTALAGAGVFLGAI